MCKRILMRRSRSDVFHIISKCFFLMGVVTAVVIAIRLPQVMIEITEYGVTFYEAVIKSGDYVGGIACCLCLYCGVFYAIRAKREFRRNVSSYVLKEELEKEEEYNALTSMQRNLVSIKLYYDWSSTQAKFAFWFAVVACAVGIVMLIIAMGAESFNVALIPAIGGAITELLAGTALLVYRTSVKQLSYYHRSLHENERMLVCVNIIEQQFKEDEERKADMLEKVIMKEMDLSLIEARHFWQEEPNHNKKKGIAVTETEEKN